ncbi:hypothetical protein HBB16_17135 [Pseudonocardia sp. MCCB 268]|nr:hypothetical protein [Pseudonocardia cytotoxica]
MSTAPHHHPPDHDRRQTTATLLSTTACIVLLWCRPASVESQIVTQLGAQGVAIDGGTADCPTDLDATVGKFTQTCEFRTGGRAGRRRRAGDRGERRRLQGSTSAPEARPVPEGAAAGL